MSLSADPAMQKPIYGQLSAAKIVEIVDSTRDNNKASNRNSSLKKAEFVPTCPTGVLAIHLKRCRQMKLDMDQQFASSNFNIYFRVQCGEHSKVTTNHEVDYNTKELDIDEIKHLSLKISRKRYDASNKVIIELIGFEGSEKHEVVGRVDFHIYDMIKKLYVSESSELKRKDKMTAELEYEACFAYGTFGYGYSSQLKNPMKSISEQTQHSMFFREEPPLNRRQEDAEIVTCIPVGQPTFIPFTQNVQIGLTHTEFDEEELDLIRRKYPEPKILTAYIRRSMYRLMKAYSFIDARPGRLRFLASLIQESKAKIQGEEPTAPTIKIVSKKDPSQPQENAGTYGIPQSKEAVLENPPEVDLVAEFGAILQAAPGIAGRSQARRRHVHQFEMNDEESDAEIDNISVRPSILLRESQQELQPKWRLPEEENSIKVGFTRFIDRMTSIFTKRRTRTVHPDIFLTPSSTNGQ